MAIATRLRFLGLVAIISGKNLYKSGRETIKSNVFRISYDFYGNYNDYGHSRDFRFNSVRTIEPTFGSISTAYIYIRYCFKATSHSRMNGRMTIETL